MFNIGFNHISATSRQRSFVDSLQFNAHGYFSQKTCPISKDSFITSYLAEMKSPAEKAFLKEF